MPLFRRLALACLLIVSSLVPALANPMLLDHVAGVVASRRTGLEEARATAATVVAPQAKQTFLARMRKFLSLQS